VGGLIRSRRILRSKYGRLYLQFGEVLPFHPMVPTAEGRAHGRKDLTPTERRALVQRVAHRVTYEINRVTIVTPAALTATALMSHRRRGVDHAALLARVRELLALFQRHGAKVARTLADRRGDLRPDAIDGALQLFVDAKLVVNEGRLLVVPEDRRMALEYHKNTVLHFFVASALVASSLAALGWETSLGTLRDRVRRLSRLFKLEFMYRADAEFEAIFSDALSRMIESDEVIWEADRVRRAGGEPGTRLVLYRNMVRTYVEAYRVALRAVVALGSKSVTKKEWLKAALASGRKALATEEITLRESVVRPKMETALAILHELGIARTEGENVHAGAKIGDAGELDAILTEHLEAE
jgi:glycerol-3-phosphate O-acyltransferase